MIEAIVDFDKKLLLLINGFHSTWADSIMLVASEKFSWLPLYAVLVFILIRSLGNRGWYLMLMAALLAVSSDQISSGFFKPFFERLRPCHEPGLRDFVRILNGHCGGQYGFLSSHATNTAGLSTLIILALRKSHTWLVPMMIFFALLNAYSRVYLGVHYPTDVLAGMGLGVILGYMFYHFWKSLSLRLANPGS